MNELNSINDLRNTSPLENTDASPYTNQYNTTNNSNPYLGDGYESSQDSKECSRVNKNGSTAEMKFVPFKFDHNDHTSASQLNDMLQNINSALSTDITTMPFIPNPYYMMNMNLLLNPNSTKSTDESQRQKGNPGPSHDHDFHPGFHPGFNIGFYPYYNPNFYPYYNPNFYPSPYGPNAINPYTFLLLSSLFNNR